MPKQFFSEITRAACNAAFLPSQERFQRLAHELHAALIAPSAGYLTEQTLAAVRGGWATLESAINSHDEEECRNIAALILFAFSRK